MIYLYRDIICEKVRKWKIPVLLLLLASMLSYILRPGEVHMAVQNLWQLAIFALWVCYAIGTDGKLLSNKITSFISGISFEVYLCHMVIFRVVEKLGLHYLLGKGWLAYLATVAIVIIGAMVFAVVAQRTIKFAGNKLCRKAAKT